MPKTQQSRQVVIVAFERAQLLDIAGPMQAFSSANDMAALAQGGRAAVPPYQVTVVSRRGGAVTTSSGLTLMTRKLRALDRAAIDTLIVAGGPGVHAAAEDAALRRWIVRRAAGARRVASVCTGAFLLAASGLLTGRRATTHWRSCARLQRLYPDIAVEGDPIYVRDGAIWTSAGVTAGIDLTLALIEADIGRKLALEAARQLVVFLKRPGGQSQFSAPLAAQARAADADPEGRFAPLHDWMDEHLAEDLRVERLAERAGMSGRNFARLYTARMGATPAKAVEARRLEAARRALEESALPIKRIAGICGFGDEERMRRVFLRHLAVGPQEYRKRFSVGGAAA